MIKWGSLFPAELTEQPHLMSPLVLAYIGDAVYELLVRSRVVSRGFSRTNEIHSQSVRYVRADAQAGVLMAISGMLVEEEADIARRGRNAKSQSMPKGVSVASYRHSTGLECLIGYLYIKGDADRLAQIMDKVFDIIEEGDNYE